MTSPCILLCESPSGGHHPLARQLRNAGIEVELAKNVQDAQRMLQQNFYDGVAIDLLLKDRDGISLAMDIRRKHRDLPIMVLTTRHRGMDSGTSETPNWLEKSASQARMVFALKQASQHNAGRRPRVLHVEADDYLADIVQHTLGTQIRLVRARDVMETELALLRGDYDLALINMDNPEDFSSNAMQLLEKSPVNMPVLSQPAKQSEPRTTIIWSLISHYDEPARSAFG